MRVPKIIKFRRFKRLFRRYGIQVVPGRKHFLLCSEDGRKYPVPARKEGDDIERAYVEGARRKFGLTPGDGVSDEEFYQAR